MAEVFEWCPWVNTWVSARVQHNGFSQQTFPCEKVALFSSIRPSNNYEHDHKGCNPHGTTFFEIEWLVRRRLLGTYIAETHFLEERWMSHACRIVQQDSCKIVHGCPTGQDSVKQVYGYGVCQDSFKLEYEQRIVQDNEYIWCNQRRLQNSADIAQLSVEEDTRQQPAAIVEPCRYCYVADNHLRWCPNALDDAYVRTQAEARWRKMGEYLRRNINR